MSKRYIADILLILLTSARTRHVTILTPPAAEVQSTQPALSNNLDPSRHLSTGVGEVRLQWATSSHGWMA